jgi:hypothetical protein
MTGRRAPTREEPESRPAGASSGFLGVVGLRRCHAPGEPGALEGTKDAAVRLTQGQASASALEIAGGGREHLLARGRDAMDVAEVNGDGQIPLSVDEVAERRGQTRCRQRVQGSDHGDHDRAPGAGDGDCRLTIRGGTIAELRATFGGA